MAENEPTGIRRSAAGCTACGNAINTSIKSVVSIPPTRPSGSLLEELALLAEILNEKPETYFGVVEGASRRAHFVTPNAAVGELADRFLRKVSIPTVSK
jgi:hypothetical protein